jgi:hypothetical protein
LDKTVRFSAGDVSSDGNRYAIAADVVYLVNAATGKTLHKLVPAPRMGAAAAANDSPVFGLAFSHDAKHLAGIVKDGTITVWESVSGKVKAMLPGEPLLASNPPADLVWFDDNTLLTPNCIRDSTLARWNIATQQAVPVTWIDAAQPPASVAGAPAKKKPGGTKPQRKPGASAPPIATTAKSPAQRQREIVGWDGQTRHFSGAIAFAPDASRAVYAVGASRADGRVNDKQLVVVDLPANRVLGEIPLYPDHVFAIDFARDSQSLMIASRWGWYTVFRVLPTSQLDDMARAEHPLSSLDRGLTENPEVLSWSRFKEGDYVQHDVTVTHNGRTVTGTASHRLDRVFADQSGISVAGSAGYDVTNLAGPTIIALSRNRTIPSRLAIDTPGPTMDLILGRFEGTTTAQGKETLNIGGESYLCEIFKFDGQRIDADGYTYPVTGRYWSCPDVPGLVVKSSSVSKLRTDLRVDMILKQIVRK